MQRPLASETSPFAVSPCSGEEPTHFLAGYILRSFSLPFQPPELHSTRTASPVPHPSPPSVGGPLGRQASREGDLPFSYPVWPPPKESWGNTTLLRWARETDILCSPWKVGGQAPGADTANFPTRGTQHTATEAPQVLGARSPPSRSTLPLKAPGEDPSRLFQLPLEPPPLAFLARGRTPAVSARGHIPPEHHCLCDTSPWVMARHYPMGPHLNPMTSVKAHEQVAGVWT